MGDLDINQIFYAIIGVLGTLSGTLLGWALNSLSKKGKLDIHVSEWNEKFQLMENTALGLKIDENSENPNQFQFSFELSIYNSSSEMKPMKEIKVSFFEKKKHIKDIFLDIGKWSNNSFGKAFNVKPKEISVFPVKQVLGDDFSSLKTYDKVCFCYTDEKQKQKSIVIRKIKDREQ